MKAVAKDKKSKALFVDEILKIEMHLLRQKSGEPVTWCIREAREDALYKKSLDYIQRLYRELNDNARRELDLSQLNEERRDATLKRETVTAEYEAEKRAEQKDRRKELESLTKEDGRRLNYADSRPRKGLGEN
jgi:hypothetical protein